MNDLTSVIGHSKICLYVDNVKLCKSISSIQSINSLQSDINISLLGVTPGPLELI